MCRYYNMVLNVNTSCQEAQKLPEYGMLFYRVAKVRLSRGDH